MIGPAAIGAIPSPWISMAPCRRSRHRPPAPGRCQVRGTSHRRVRGGAVARPDRPARSVRGRQRPRRRPRYATTVVSPAGGVLRTSSGLAVVADSGDRPTTGPHRHAGGGRRQGHRAGRGRRRPGRLGHGARRRSQPAGHLGVQRRASWPRRAARRAPRHHPLAVCDLLAGSIRASRSSPTASTCTTASGVDLRRGDRGHGPGARPGGGRPRRHPALEVARRLVLFTQRGGGQSQFSTQLTVARAERRAAAGACWPTSPTTSTPT